MRTILRSSMFNERSYDVNLQHKILKTWGLPSAEREVAEGKAWDNALIKVGTLHAHLNTLIDNSCYRISSIAFGRYHRMMRISESFWL